MVDEVQPIDDGADELDILSDASGTYMRVVLAALSSLPWVGVFFAIGGVLSAENEQGKVNKLVQATLNEHKDKFKELEYGLKTMAARIDSFGDEAKTRVQDESYLDVVRKGFRVWDRCETKSKRDYVFSLLTNAASTNLVEDDIVRLFLDWIDRYHDAHFDIIRAVFQNEGMTRLDLWREMGGEGQLPAENSSKADLFRMLVHDLSTGRVIRQERDYDAHAGRWLKQRRRQVKKGHGDPYTESSFEDTKRYQLTELGKEFVRYVLQEAVTRIEGSADGD